MLQIKIEEVAPFDGTYDLDLTRFNGRELHLIKEISGVRLGEIQEALNANDFDVIVALAAIALTRDGRVTKDMSLRAARELLEADFGKLSLIDPDAKKPDEDAAVPPTVPPTGGEESFESSSPGSSSTSDDPPETTPPSTGPAGSPTGAMSLSPTLVS